MIPLKILSLKEKKEIEKDLERQFGIKYVPGLIIQKGRERLFLFGGKLNPKGIKDLEMLVPIERVGVYFAKVVDGGLRLSMEGAQILRNQIEKNTFELDDKQAEIWMHGSELLIKTGKYGFLVMKHKEDILGTGKASVEKITNFIPKSRRLKNRENEPIK